MTSCLVWVTSLVSSPAMWRWKLSHFVYSDIFKNIVVASLHRYTVSYENIFIYLTINARKCHFVLKCLVFISFSYSSRFAFIFRQFFNVMIFNLWDKWFLNKKIKQILGTVSDQRHGCCNSTVSIQRAKG